MVLYQIVDIDGVVRAEVQGFDYALALCEVYNANYRKVFHF